MKRVIFHPEADAEMVAAAEFYDGKSTGLGTDFTACCIGSKASESSWLPLRISGGGQGTGVTANLPNLRFQRAALRAAAEPLGPLAGVAQQPRR